MRNSIDNVNQNDAVEASAEAVIESIRSVVHGLRALASRDQSAAVQALTPMDGKVLSFFAKHAGATQKDLVAHSGRDKGQLTRLISGLKDRGLLEGQADEADRRQICLQLTAEGRVAQRALQAQNRRRSQHAIAVLSGAERQQLLMLLRKVQAGLSNVT